MRTLSEHIMDIVQNSISAKATLIEIMVNEQKKEDICMIAINDNGRGMNEEMVQQVTNPFFTTRKTRKVGLGISLLKQNAEACEGEFILNSRLGEGTEVKAIFKMTHLDKPPLGDVWETFYLTMLSNEQIELVYHHRTEEGDFRISSDEIRGAVEGVPLHKKEIKDGITDLFIHNLKEINIKL